MSECPYCEKGDAPWWNGRYHMHTGGVTCQKAPEREYSSRDTGTKDMTPNKYSQRQLATVLAALRHWQTQRNREIGSAHMTIATDGGSFERLDDDEIDALCERINAGEDPARAELEQLEAEFERAGGRGIELAERIDELREGLGE